MLHESIVLADRETGLSLTTATSSSCNMILQIVANVLHFQNGYSFTAKADSNIPLIKHILIIWMSVRTTVILKEVKTGRYLLS